MLLRAVAAQGWDPQKDVNISDPGAGSAGPALQAARSRRHADFVPFSELFEHRGIARKIFDGSQANAPTYHGSLVNAEYAKKYPEVVVAFLRCRARGRSPDRREPEKYSELIEKVTGIEAGGELPVPRSARACRPRPSLEARVPPGAEDLDRDAQAAGRESTLRPSLRRRPATSARRSSSRA
jgi:ABC-type nitrate/sulfonate/bicarbonate transport system substrate-binding protein